MYSHCVLLKPSGAPVPCTFCFSIRRDIMDLPSLVIGACSGIRSSLAPLTRLRSRPMATTSMISGHVISDDPPTFTCNPNAIHTRRPRLDGSPTFACCLHHLHILISRFASLCRTAIPLFPLPYIPSVYGMPAFYIYASTKTRSRLALLECNIAIKLFSMT